MRKFFYSLLVLVMLFSTLAAAPMSVKTASLESVRFVPGKGMVFLFNVSGITSADIKNATFTVEKNIYPLYCAFNDFGQVNCNVTAGGIKQVLGRNGVVTWGGFQFSVTLPAETCLGQGVFNMESDGDIFYTIATNLPELKAFLGRYSSQPISNFECIQEEWKGYPALYDVYIGSAN